MPHWCFGNGIQADRSTWTVEDTILAVALLFAQFFGATSDSLEHFFHLTLLVG